MSRRPLIVACLVVGTLLASAGTGWFMNADGGATPVPDGSRAIAHDATVGLVAWGCKPGGDRGSGMLIAGRQAMVSAHVVAGAKRIEVAHRGVAYAGEVIAFDPDMDIAVVRLGEVTDSDVVNTSTAQVDGLGDVSMVPFATTRVDRGVPADVWVWRSGDVVRLDAVVQRPVQITTEDVYIEGETIRPGYELTADIKVGDSGGAVVVDGEIVGIVWARSRKQPGRSYAIDVHRGGDLLRQQLSTGELGQAIDLTRC